MRARPSELRGPEFVGNAAPSAPEDVWKGSVGVLFCRPRFAFTPSHEDRRQGSAALLGENAGEEASRGAGGLSQLSIWCVKLGILHERIEPSHPEQNGRYERMHRTLKQETLRPPAASMRSQQVRFDASRTEFNEERPHEGIANDVPAAL